MTDANVCACGQPAHNSYLCSTCTARLVNIFPTISELWSQLEIRMTKERGVDYRGRGGSRSSEPPAVITDPVTELRNNVRASIYNAAAQLADEAPALAVVLALRDTTTYRCIVLHQYANRLATSVNAPRLLHALTVLVDEMTRKIDTPPGRVYQGRCLGVGLADPDAIDHTTPCGRDLYVPEEGRHALATVNCGECGLTYSLKQLHDHAVSAYVGKLVTPPEASILLGINRNTVNQWAKRKRIHPRGEDGNAYDADVDDRKLYLVKELLELARERKESAA